ncbi:hypothetical protein ACLB1Q_31990 [Escherichia coli]
MGTASLSCSLAFSPGMRIGAMARPFLKKRRESIARKNLDFASRSILRKNARR